MEFKNKKEAAVKLKHEFNKKLIINTEYLELKRKECAELTENQYNLELKTAVGMIYDKTQQKLTHYVTIMVLNFFFLIYSIYYNNALNQLESYRSCMEVYCQNWKVKIN